MRYGKLFDNQTVWTRIFAVYTCIALGSGASPQAVNEALMTRKNQGGPVVYVALGDSTGIGVGAKEGGYVARLFTRIERDRPGSRLVNLCSSGSTTEDVLAEQVEPAIKASPSLVTIGIGINDIANGATTEEFARNFEAIVTRIKKALTAHVVVTNLPDISLAPIVPRFMRDEAHRRVVVFNERIKEIAGRNGLVVVDAYTVTRDAIPAHPEFFSSDGFHPSDPGYEYWAKTMWPAVKNAIGE